MKAASSIRWFLENHEWIPLSRGAAGALWKHESGSIVAVPDGVQPDSPYWSDIIDRVAAPLKISPVEASAAIRNVFIDIAEFRAADDKYIEASIPVEAGFSLVSTARSLLRASATTSRGARAYIGGNYSKPGERIVENARFGHTKRGSYILPMYVPLGIEDPESPDNPQMFRLPAESDERRVTRTMAQALTAIENKIVDPQHEPSDAMLGDLVTAGVSREMVRAIHEILSEETVTTFTTQFKWASGVSSNDSLPKQVAFPADAAELLDRTAKRMRPLKKSAYETITGPIVQLRDESALTFGEVTVQTTRKGRNCEVTVVLSDEALDRSHEWFRDRETLVVEGHIESVPGRGLRIGTVRRIQPLAETLLFSQEPQLRK